ncbi:MAG: hypothetical protein ABI224_16360 [Acetobacteraceae bacterium]
MLIDISVSPPQRLRVEHPEPRSDFAANQWNSAEAAMEAIAREHLTLKNPARHARRVALSLWNDRRRAWYVATATNVRGYFPPQQFAPSGNLRHISDRDEFGSVVVFAGEMSITGGS